MPKTKVILTTGELVPKDTVDTVILFLNKRPANIVLGHYDDKYGLEPQSFACSDKTLQESGLLDRRSNEFREHVWDILLACYPGLAAVYPDFPDSADDLAYVYPVSTVDTTAYHADRRPSMGGTTRSDEGPVKHNLTGATTGSTTKLAP